MMLMSEIDAFVRVVTGGSRDRDARQRLFWAIREFPYATDAAHDAASLLIRRRGDCLAKSDLLACAFSAIDIPVRRVRWLYELPGQPPEVARLPTRLDVHTAVQAQVDGRWRLVDPTHDSALGALALTVAEWDGIGDTVPAYEPAGPMWRETEDAAQIRGAIDGIDVAYGSCAREALLYRRAFNSWLDRARLPAGT
jgi:transglutaminase-like putative cysteine protease